MMEKNYLVMKRLRLYGRSYEVGEVIGADDADVADLVGRVLKEAHIVSQGEATLGDPNDPPVPLTNALDQAHQAVTEGTQAVAALHQTTDVGQDNDDGQSVGDTQPGRDGGDTPPADDTPPAQDDGQSDAGSNGTDSAPAQEPAAKKAAPVVKKASTTKAKK